MSDANKAMIDASGRLIRGATHPYVIADDLYPMVPTQQDAFYGREKYTYPVVSCCLSDIWDVAWADPVESLDYYATCYNTYFPIPGAWYSGARQNVVSTTFTGSEIDWARVKKLTRTIVVSAGNFIGSAAARFTVSKNNSTPPTGKTIRDTWGTLFSYTADQDIHYKTLEWDINGVEPDSVEAALCFDNDACPSEDIRGDVGVLFFEPVRIVYNLATT
jgi:hypothetical protein